MKNLDKPLISIIVPVYNVEKYIEECVESLVDQTYECKEIILVDDESPDLCPQMCDEFARKYECVKVIHKKNGGASSARNVGIESAAGDYIAFVDSDDKVDIDMYESMMRAAIENNADMVCCGRFILNGGQVTGEKFKAEELTVFTQEEAAREVLTLGKMDVAPWDKLYKASLFKDIRYPEGEIHEDSVVILPLLKQCNKIVHVGKSYYYYRINLSGVTKSAYSSRMRVVLPHLEKMAEYVDANFPGLKKEMRSHKGMYSLSLAIGLLRNKEELKKFNDDFRDYRSAVVSCLPEIITNKNASVKTKIDAILVAAGSYRIVHCIIERRSL